MKRLAVVLGFFLLMMAGSQESAVAEPSISSNVVVFKINWAQNSQKTIFRARAEPLSQAELTIQGRYEDSSFLDLGPQWLEREYPVKSASTVRGLKLVMFEYPGTIIQTAWEPTCHPGPSLTLDKSGSGFNLLFENTTNQTLYLSTDGVNWTQKEVGRWYETGYKDSSRLSVSTQPSNQGFCTSVSWRSAFPPPQPQSTGQ